MKRLLTCLLALLVYRADAQFTLFNWVRYNGTPASLKPYLQPMYLSLQGLTNADSTPNFAAVKSFATSALPDTSAPASLDIEIWPYSPAAALSKSIDRYNAVIDSFRTANPYSKLGFYGVPPQQRYYWSLISTPSQYNAWMVINDSLERMASNVDLYFPSAYCHDTITSGWQKYIDSNVAVIRRLYSPVKPIYVYIWPQYDGASAGVTNAQFVDTARWKTLLNIVYNSGANGAVIWTSNEDSLGNTISWTSNMPWWTVTKEFMVGKGLVAPFVLDSLKAVYTAGGQQIRWVTSTDTTTAYFRIQRSTDSVNFTTISGPLASQKAYYTQNTYTFTDPAAAGGRVYYRLERVNTDSSTAYTTAVAYAPPLNFRSAGTGLTVDLATAGGWQVENNGVWSTATIAPNTGITPGSTVTIGAPDTWQNNTTATTIPAGAILVDSGANGSFSTTNKLTAAGTIVYAGTFAQSIPAIAAFSSSSLTNLTIDNPAGVSTTTGSWTLTGTLTLQTGQFNCNNGGGSFFCKGSIVAAGGTLNAAGYLEMLGTTPQSIPANTLLNNTIYHLITGTSTLSSNGPISITNSIALGSGTFVLGGDLTINGTTITTTGGTIRVGPHSVTLGSATTQIIPAAFFSGDTLATLTVNGTATDTIKSGLTIGTGLNVTTLGASTPLFIEGQANLSGSMVISGFVDTPAVGQQFTLLYADSVNGTFAGGLKIAGLPSTRTGSLSYTGTAVLLTIDSVVQTGEGGQPCDSVLIRIFPNPVWSNCLVLSDKAIRSIVIYDAKAREVGRIWTGGFPIVDVPMGGRPAGIYYIMVMGNGFKTTKKILKL